MDPLPPWLLVFGALITVIVTVHSDTDLSHDDLDAFRVGFAGVLPGVLPGRATVETTADFVILTSHVPATVVADLDGQPVDVATAERLEHSIAITQPLEQGDHTVTVVATTSTGDGDGTLTANISYTWTVVSATPHTVLVNRPTIQEYDVVRTSASVWTPMLRADAPVSAFECAVESQALATDVNSNCCRQAHEGNTRCIEACLRHLGINDTLCTARDATQRACVRDAARSAAETHSDRAAPWSTCDAAVFDLDVPAEGVVRVMHVRAIGASGVVGEPFEWSWTVMPALSYNFSQSELDSAGSSADDQDDGCPSPHPALIGFAVVSWVLLLCLCVYMYAKRETLKAGWNPQIARMKRTQKQAPTLQVRSNDLSFVKGTSQGVKKRSGKSKGGRSNALTVTTAAAGASPARLSAGYLDVVGGGGEAFEVESPPRRKRLSIGTEMPMATRGVTDTVENTHIVASI